MSLPTVYPGDLIPTSGDLTILPIYPSVEEVVLKSEQVVLSTGFASYDVPVSLLDGLSHVVATLSLPAQPIDCVVSFHGISTLTPDSGTGVSVWGTINDVMTPTIGAYIPSSIALESNPATVPFQGQSGNVLAGTPIVVRIFLQLAVPSDITTIITTFAALASPTPLV